MNGKNMIDLRKILSFFLVVIIFGCKGNTVDATCSSKKTQSSVIKKINENVEKTLSKEKYSNERFIFDEAKIRDFFKQIESSLEMIITIREDPNSRKKFCSADLKEKIPLTIIDKTNIYQYARENGIENNDNSFIIKEIKYNIQPTDDKKDIYVEIESEIASSMLSEIALSALFKPMLEEKKAELEQKKTFEAIEIDNLKKYKNESTYSESENKEEKLPEKNESTYDEKSIATIKSYFSSLSEGDAISSISYWYQPSNKIKNLIINSISNKSKYYVMDYRITKSVGNKTDAIINLRTQIKDQLYENWQGIIHLIMVDSDWKISSMNMKKN